MYQLIYSHSFDPSGIKNFIPLEPVLNSTTLYHDILLRALKISLDALPNGIMHGLAEYLNLTNKVGLTPMQISHVPIN
jgi:hypothetical protein